jgi:malate/lactate dehydrogenase
MRAGVVGVGKLGGTVAHALAGIRAWDSLVLSDVIEPLAWAQAEDIRHAFPRGVHVRAGSVEDLDGADLVVVAAGQGRKPGMTRTDLLDANAPVIADLGRRIARVAPKATLVVLTNPLDVMTTVAWRASGLPRAQVVGSGALVDSVRFRLLLADRHGVDLGAVDAAVLGEHGERAVPVFSRAAIGGKPLRLNSLQHAEISAAMRALSARIIAEKGATAFGPAGCTAELVRALLSEDPSVVPASAVLDGEYGIRGVALGVPARVGRGRVLGVEEWSLHPEELAALRAAGHEMAGLAARALGT